jgi:Uma2 family endonuclease
MAALTSQEGTGPTRYRFTVEQFYRLGDVGVLAPDERVELVDGAIITLAPPGPKQASVISLLNRLVIEHTSDDMRVGVHNPIHLDGYTEPRPSLCLSRSHPGQIAHPIPTDIFFVIDVVDGTLDHERDARLSLYAVAGILESWLFDVKAKMLERHTEPRDGVYQQVARVGRGEALASTTLPALTLAVDDLLR